METWPITSMPMWAQPYGFDRCIKVEHTDVHQENLLPGLECDWNQQADVTCADLRWLPELMK